MTTPAFIIAPNGRWSAREATGLPAVGGLLFTYRNLTTTPKATYADPAGTIANPNPIVLDQKGEADIFWATDDYYTIIVRDPETLQVIYSQDNYPAVGGSSSGDIIINQAFPNLVRNAQFSFFPTSPYTNFGTTQEHVFDDWAFFRSNLSSSNLISAGPFSPGQTQVPAYPVYYFHYECTNVGAGGEIDKGIYQAFNNVQTLSGATVSFGVWLRGNTVVSIYLQQDFGVGGSESLGIPLLVNISLSDWAQHTVTVTLPSIEGKTIGLYSELNLMFFFAPNTLGFVDIANVQLHNADAVPSFAYLTLNDQQKYLDSMVPQSTFITGDYKHSLNPNPTFGWVVCNDGTIGSATSGATWTGTITQALYDLIWFYVADAWAPIFDSAGNRTSRGANPVDDFNANKRLGMTFTIGRVLANVGGGPLLGQYLGESAVTLDINTMPSHSHNAHAIYDGQLFSNFPTPKPYSPTEPGNMYFTNLTVSIDPTGGGQPHNNMQPTVFTYVHLKL